MENDDPQVTITSMRNVAGVTWSNTSIAVAESALPLSFSRYQRLAKKTVIYPEQFKIMYPALGLGGEAGEVSGKISKIYRDSNGVFTEEHKKEIGKEIADTLWFIAALASDLGLDLGQIAQENLDKLASRAQRGKLGGSGDNR